jgi:hypothetical protein
MAVAVSERIPGALIAASAQELCDLVLQRLLQDQPGTETPDRLDRVLLALTPDSTSSSSRRNLSLGLPSACERTSIFDFFGVKAEATPV